MSIDPSGNGKTELIETEQDSANPKLYLAGFAAERCWFGRTLSDPEGSSDYRAAERVAGPDFRRWIPATEELIEKHRNAVLLIAGELKQRHRLSGDQARELFDQASRSVVISAPPPSTKTALLGIPQNPLKKPHFGDTPKNPRTPSKRTLRSQKVIVEKNTKNGLDSWTFRSGKKGDPYFRVMRSGAGYSLHFRHKNAAQKWVEPYACYLSAEEFARIKRLTFSGVAQVIADKIAERQPSGNVGAEELAELLQHVREITNQPNPGSRPKGGQNHE